MGRAFIEVESKRTRKVSLRVAEPRIHVENPADLPLSANVLNDNVRLLVVSVNKAGLERSVERIVPLRNNLIDPFAIGLRRAWRGFTARFQR